MEALFQAITPLTHVITANSRQSSYCRQRYNDFMVEAAHTLWESPTILPLNRWIEHLKTQWLIAHPAEAKRTLTNFEELLLWEQLIESDQRTRHTQYLTPLLQPKACAKLALEAANLWSSRVVIDAIILPADVESFVLGHFFATMAKKGGVYQSWPAS